MNKFQKDLDTIVSGAFSDGMMFQAKGTLTNNDARKLKDGRIKQHLQLFKDTVERGFDEFRSSNERVDGKPRFGIPHFTVDIKDFYDRFRQNLEKEME
mgnify:FL=1